MRSISTKEFAKKFIQGNKGEKYKDVVKSLKEALNRKSSGAQCIQCGQPIWAIGSAVGGFEGCFTCITGESDDSNDYEVIE